MSGFSLSSQCPSNWTPVVSWMECVFSYSCTPTPYVWAAALSSLVGFVVLAKFLLVFHAHMFNIDVGVDCCFRHCTCHAYNRCPARFFLFLCEFGMMTVLVSFLTLVAMFLVHLVTVLGFRYAGFIRNDLVCIACGHGDGCLGS